MAEKNEIVLSDDELLKDNVDESSIENNDDNKPLLTEVVKKKKWREKAIDPVSGKTYKELYEAQKTNQPVKPDPQPKAPEAKPEPGAPEQKYDLTPEDVLALQAEGYNAKEILELSRKAKSLKVPASQLLADDTFKAGIEAKRAEEKVKQGTPIPSARSGFAQKAKDIKDIKDPQERQAKFNEMKRGRKTNESE